MTKEQRRSIYWEMYTVAVGLDVLMTPKEIISYNDCRASQIPACMCFLIDQIEMGLCIKCLSELTAPRYKDKRGLWYDLADWNIRSKKLLDAIKKTY